MAGIVEQTLLEQQNIDLDEMVTMNQMIDQLLPDADKDLRQKLKVKIYNFVRSRKQPSITVRRKKYFKPAVAKLIMGNMQDYADAIERRAQQPAENNNDAKKKEAASKKVKTVTKRKIFEKVLDNDQIDQQTQKKLDDKMASIIKINLIKPVNNRGSFSETDGEKIITELNGFYQNIKIDAQHRKNSENQKDQTEQSANENQGQSKHPFEIRKNNKNNRTYNKQTNKRRNRNNYDRRNNYDYEENSSLRERYNNVIRNYGQLERRYSALQEKYNQVLDDKAKLIEEKSPQNEELKRALLAVLQTL